MSDIGGVAKVLGQVALASAQIEGHSAEAGVLDVQSAHLPSLTVATVLNERKYHATHCGECDVVRAQRGVVVDPCVVDDRIG